MRARARRRRARPRSPNREPALARADSPPPTVSGGLTAPRRLALVRDDRRDAEAAHRPSPTTSGPASPSMSVTQSTRTPTTSMIASERPASRGRARCPGLARIRPLPRGPRGGAWRPPRDRAADDRDGVRMPTMIPPCCCRPGCARIGGGLRPDVEVALDRSVVEDRPSLGVVRRPAGPLVHVHGLQVVEVREHVLRVVGVHHLLHAPDELGALLRVELLPLLVAQLVEHGAWTSRPRSTSRSGWS